MFFYRYTIASTHLHRYQADIHKRFLSGRCERVKSSSTGFRIYKFFDNVDRDWIYFAIDHKLAKKVQPKVSKQPSSVILGFCSLTKLPRWLAMEVSIVYTNPQLRGKGIASMLYDAILRDGVILISGYSQCSASRHLWMKIIQNPLYVTWAHDIVNLKRYSQVTVENNQFDCSLRIYQDIKKVRRKRREDIRFIAIYPRYLKHPL